MKKYLITAAAAVAAALAIAPAANAATNSEVCRALDKVPSVMLVALAMQDSGLTDQQIGEQIASSVMYTCPRHLPLLEQFIVTYGE